MSLSVNSCLFILFSSSVSVCCSGKPFNVISVSGSACRTTYKTTTLWKARQLCWFRASGRRLNPFGEGIGGKRELLSDKDCSYWKSEEHRRTVFLGIVLFQCPLYSFSSSWVAGVPLVSVPGTLSRVFCHHTHWFLLQNGWWVLWDIGCLLFETALSRTASFLQQASTNMAAV